MVGFLYHSENKRYNNASSAFQLLLENKQLHFKNKWSDKITGISFMNMQANNWTKVFLLFTVLLSVKDLWSFLMKQVLRFLAVWEQKHLRVWRLCLAMNAKNVPSDINKWNKREALLFQY